MVNVHTGSHRGLGRTAGLTRLAIGLREVLSQAPGPPDGPIIALENSAGMGDAIGSRIEDLVDILEASARTGTPTPDSSAPGACGCCT